MNKKEILKKVAGIIAELNEQYEYLSQDPENLNELELELFAANADFLSDHIIILQKLNQNSISQNSGQNSPLATERISPEPIILKPAEKLIVGEEVEPSIPEWKFEIKDDSNQTFDYEDKATQDLFDRPLTLEELEVIEEKTQLMVQPEDNLETILEESSESEIFEENSIEPESVFNVLESSTIETPLMGKSEPELEEQPLTMNEILASQTSQSTVSSQFNQRQVKDLKSLINLNDKLLFVRDLFNGYSLAYSEAIEILNRFDSFESADNFLKQNYSSKNNWAEKQNVADKFYEILNKRFSR
jgi:hypothetical protein